MMYCMRIIHLLNLFVNTYSYIFRVYYNKSKKTDKMNGFRDTLTKNTAFYPSVLFCRFFFFQKLQRFFFIGFLPGNLFSWLSVKIKAAKSRKQAARKRCHKKYPDL